MVHMVQKHEVKVKLDNSHIKEIRKLWRPVENASMNPIVLLTGLGKIEISPICYEDMGCQGQIVVRDANTNKVKLTAEMKRGVITWFIGELVEENDIPTFIEVVNYVRMLTQFVKPVVDLLPTEHYMKPSWEVDVALYRKDYTLPDYAKEKHQHQIILKLI